MASPIRILIIGNGFGGTYVLKHLHKLFCNDRRIQISLIGDKNYFLFTPLLHEVATGSIDPENITEPVHEVLGCCLDKFYLGKADKIDLVNKTVEVQGEIREKISYDYLVLAPGAETNYYNIPGAQEFTLPIKSLEDAIKIKNRFITELERASHIEDREERKRALSFVVIGGGATGVELVAEMHEFLIETFSNYYKEELIKEITITLIQKEGELIPQFAPKLREKSLQVLRKKGVDVMLSTEVKEIKKGEIITNTGSLFSETIIWVAGIKPNDLKFEGTVPKLQNGRLVIKESLQLEEYKEVFALGDSAFFLDKVSNRPLPALAQVAVKQAKVVAKNIKLLAENKEPKKFIYKSSGSLLSVGQWMGLGEVGGLVFSGRFAWWIWRTTYLFKLISNIKKVKVATDWTMDLFGPRDISQL